MENKNTLIAVALMLAVWIGFTLFFPPTSPDPVTTQVTTEIEPATPRVPSPSISGPAAERPLPPDFDATESIPTREITVENEFYRVVLTSSGARIVSLHLKEFYETAEAHAPYAMVEGPEDRWNLSTYGTEGLHLPSDASYRLETAATQIRLQGEEAQRLVFTASLPGGLVSEKIYSFYGNRYSIDLQVRLLNAGEETLRGTLAVSQAQPWSEEMKKGYFEFVGPATFADEKLHQDDAEDVEKRPASYGPETVWTGFVGKYFLSALIPSTDSVSRVQVEKSQDIVYNTVFTPSTPLGPGESAEFDYVAFFGPKDIDVLSSVHPQLSEAIDFGFFSFLARPLLHVLKFFYTYLGNYGLSIIVLTVIIKILFWPLTHKSYASMKSMQKLQPQMQKLRDKHKNDREKLNREIMELYKTHRVNPLGGCLPMIVQIPVFFALYKVLMISIELRHAPFIFWIQDLAAKDPYYITPLIMGATMFLQMKMSPTTMDPMQAKLFMLMPVIFTFMFLNFPSGLVLYWMVNNILTILQQYMINRRVA